MRLTYERRVLNENSASIEEFRARQAVAFGAEREAWAAAGEFDPRPEEITSAPTEPAEVPPGATVIEAPFVGNVWRIEVEVGAVVAGGQTVVSLEAMKLEAVVTAPRAGRVHSALVSTGVQVAPGTALIVLEAEEDA